MHKQDGMKVVGNSWFKLSYEMMDVVKLNVLKLSGNPWAKISNQYLLYLQTTWKKISRCTTFNKTPNLEKINTAKSK